MVTVARRERASRSSSAATPIAAQPMKNEPCVLPQATMMSGMSHSNQGCLRRQARMAMTAAKKTTAKVWERRARLVAATRKLPRVTMAATTWLVSAARQATYTRPKANPMRTARNSSNPIQPVASKTAAKTTLAPHC